MTSFLEKNTSCGIFTIPFAENFFKTLINKVINDVNSQHIKHATIILPGQHITEKYSTMIAKILPSYTNRIKCVSYDDIAMCTTKNDMKSSVESIFIETVINNTLLQIKQANTSYMSKHILRKKLIRAVNEFFYYGLDHTKLICIENRHHLFHKIISRIIEIVGIHNVSLSHNRLTSLVGVLSSGDNNHSNTNLVKIDTKLAGLKYAVLPIVHSPVIYQILYLLHTQTQIQTNIVIHGVDMSIEKEILDKIMPDHPQYHIVSFLNHMQIHRNNITILSSGNVVNNFGIDKGISQLMLPASMVHLWHKHQLYSFSHISIYDASSPADELFNISDIIDTNAEKYNEICVITKTSDKARIVWKYLKHSEAIAKKHLPIYTSVPNTLLDHESVEFFYILMQYLLNQKEDITQLIALLKHVASIVRQEHHDEILHFEYILLHSERVFFDSTIDEIIVFLQNKKFVYVIDALKIISQCKHTITDTASQAFIQLQRCFPNTINAICDATVNVKELTTLKNLLIEVFDTQKSDRFSTMLQIHLYTYLKLISGNFITQNVVIEMLQLLLEMQGHFTFLMANELKSSKTLKNGDYRRAIECCVNENTVSDDLHQPDNIVDSISNTKISVTTVIESRFMTYDLVILCDLNEGVWPPSHDEEHNFISDITRNKYGYSNPKLFEVGYAAHDFASFICASKKVIISNLKSNGISINHKPRIISRWVSLLQAYSTIGKNNIQIAPSKQQYQSSSCENTSATAAVPAHLRPQILSATSIEKLLRNPYLYYLEYILKLQYLPQEFVARDTLPSSKEFGIILHKILHSVSNTIDNNYASCSDYNTYYNMFWNVIERILKHRYGEGFLYKQRLLLWKNRFNNIIYWMHCYEMRLSKKYQNIVTMTEKKLSITLDLKNNTNIILQAYADRIDVMNNPYHIYISDYKTGQIPTKKDIVTGLKSQLNLEALILHLSQKYGQKINIIKLKQIMKKHHHYDSDTTLQYIRLVGLLAAHETKQIQSNIKSTAAGIIQITDMFYHKLAPYNSTGCYDHYLQAHIMRTSHLIEYKI